MKWAKVIERVGLASLLVALVIPSRSLYEEGLAESRRGHGGTDNDNGLDAITLTKR